MVQRLSRQLSPVIAYSLAVVASGLTTLLVTPLRDDLDLVNIVMLFLLTVVLVAASLGRGPAVLAAFVSVALFDFYFVPPRFSFAVADAQHLLTFVVMLTVALITGGLTAGLRRQAEAARERERRSQALYELARDLAGALTAEQVAAIGRSFLARTLGFQSALLLTNVPPQLEVIPGADEELPVEIHLAQMALAQGTRVECDPLVGEGFATAYFPLLGPMSVRGVLAVAPRESDPRQVREQQALMETVASLLAIALERVHYAEVARGAEVTVAAERLRSSILSALSHDLRTPLTALRGMAEALAWELPPDTAAGQREAAEAIRDQALRLSGMVTNLLEMARLQAGKVPLRLDWQSLEEVLGGALKLLEPSLQNHPVQINLPPDLPLLEFDAVLIERVLCNLLENALKYAPADSPIDISACQVAGQAGEAGAVEVAVADRGPGFPPGSEGSLFDLFVRGEAESAQPGMGLGLAICRAIVEAHGGSISAANRPEGGACVRFTLPLHPPPALADEAEILAARST
ncbi:MAG: DUF4118 domain-containing protein [Betaproteobacteria bacterium]|nr:DUF4118 domain-containing protein [Betaproteobacteria bacterium]